MMKMFKSFGDVFSKLAFPMDENDRWFEAANSQVSKKYIIFIFKFRLKN